MVLLNPKQLKIKILPFQSTESHQKEENKDNNKINQKNNHKINQKIIIVPDTLLILHGTTRRRGDINKLQVLYQDNRQH